MLEEKRIENEALGNPMGYAPMLPLIAKMAVPCMLSMLIQALYNVVDSIFVSMISQQALAAVSLVFPIQNLIIGTAVGTGVGLNSLVSRRLGEKNQDSANKAATHGIILGLITGTLFAFLAIFTQPFFNVFSDDPNLVSMAVSYADIIMTCSFAVFTSINIEKILQATGNVMDPMKIMLIGTFTNLVLDPIMIFGMFGFPAMGVAGAALATVTAQIASMLFALWVCFTKKKKHEVHITLRKFRFCWTTVVDIYRVGIPSIIMQCIGSIMVSGMNIILIKFSEAAVSVFGIYFKLQSFIFMPIFGLSSGLMPIMGFCYGARKKKRLMSALKYGLAISAVIMIVGSFIFWLFTPQLLSVFNPDAALLEIGIPALKILAVCFIPAAVGITVSTLFQAVGSGVYSLLISILRQLIGILPMAFFLAQFGVNAVWWAIPFSETISMLASAFFYYRLSKSKIAAIASESNFSECDVKEI